MCDGLNNFIFHHNLFENLITREHFRMNKMKYDKIKIIFVGYKVTRDLSTPAQNFSKKCYLYIFLISKPISCRATANIDWHSISVIIRENRIFIVSLPKFM